MQGTKTVNVRGVSIELWQKFRSIALMKDLSVKEALEQALQLWLKGD